MLHAASLLSSECALDVEHGMFKIAPFVLVLKSVVPLSGATLHRPSVIDVCMVCVNSSSGVVRRSI